MRNEFNTLQKARYYSSVSVVYLITLLFAWYVFNPHALSNRARPVIYSQAPLPEQIAVKPKLPVKPILSGKPNRLIISQANNGLDLDLSVVDGAYNPNDNTWFLSERNAQYALPSVLANDTTGTTLIYGHNNKFVFGYLSAIHANAGATAQVYTDNGHVFNYIYDKLDSVSPDDTSVFNYSGPPKLIVQTCGGSFFEYRQLFNFKLQQVDGHNV